MRYSVWTPVRVVAENHERAGQAGLVWKISPKFPGHVVVKWDSDDTQESIEVDLVEAL